MNINPAHDFLRSVEQQGGGKARPLVAEGHRSAVFHAGEVGWTPLPGAGSERKVLRIEPQAQRSVMLLRMAPGASTGLHTHSALTESLFLSGGLVDYQGYAGAGVFGINFAGATHDACTDVGCVLVLRAEGPVYPVELTPEFRGEDRDDGLAPIRTDVLGPPDVNVEVDRQPWRPTGVDGVQRRALRHALGSNRGACILRLEPGARVPRHRALHLVDTYVLAGSVRDEWGEYAEGDYVLAPARVTRSLATDGGCLLLVWADGPVVFADGSPGDLYFAPQAHVAAADVQASGRVTADTGDRRLLAI